MAFKMATCVARFRPSAPIMRRYIQVIGRMPALYSGIGLFTAAGFVTAYATDTDVLLIARFVQGVYSASSPIRLASKSDSA